jgi:lysozyme
MASLTTSLAGQARIQGYEKCVLTAYQARIQGKLDVPTIGWGHTGDDVYMGLVWTREQADAAFARDLSERFEPTVNRVCDGVPTTQGQFDAMVCLTYNIGAHGFASSEVAKRHRAGDYNAAADAFEHWDHYHGEVNEALHNRRVVEGQAYLDASPGAAPYTKGEPTPALSQLDAGEGHQKALLATGTGPAVGLLSWWANERHKLGIPEHVVADAVGLISGTLVWLVPSGRRRK